jgi:hypothetical protein
VTSSVAAAIAVRRGVMFRGMGCLLGVLGV